jgi:hypothetical protein
MNRHCEFEGTLKGNLALVRAGPLPAMAVVDMVEDTIEGLIGVRE